jgi:hypothetical protein
VEGSCGSARRTCTRAAQRRPGRRGSAGPKGGHDASRASKKARPIIYERAVRQASPKTHAHTPSLPLTNAWHALGLPPEAPACFCLQLEYKRNERVRSDLSR